MKNFFNIFSLKSLIFSTLLFFSTLTHAAATYTEGSSAQELASKITGVGITITNPVITYGTTTQRGVFSNGIAGAGLEIDEGIILTTMSVSQSFAENSSQNYSVSNPNNNDADLLNIDANAHYNTIVFEFDVTLDENTRLLLIDYQFASEEYHEYVGTKFNDAFGFFISGGDLPADTVYNIARVVDHQTYVTIDDINSYKTVVVNHVNNGSPGSYAPLYPATGTVDYNNSAFFIDNDQNNDGGTSPVTVEYDGLTTTLHATLDKLTPGETYHFKMAIADSSDSNLNTGVFVNKISGLTEPSICYDYAYKQDGLYLTEGYDPLKGPFINADVSTSSPVEVSMYFKNTHSSEIIASNVTLDITDLNTSQATYTTESVSVIEPNSLFKTKINDVDLNVSSSYVKAIPITSFDAFEYFYNYFSINPVISTLTLPIHARINYDLIIPLSANRTTTVPRSSIIDTDVPICSGGSSLYEPVYGIFNIIENGLYTDSTNYFYNINTQITNREAQLSIVTIDSNLTANPDLHNITNGVTTAVGVDMLDLKSFHYTSASCSEAANTISDRSWIIINGSGVTPLTTNNTDFYKVARENVAMRISYNVRADDGDLIQLEPVVKDDETRWNVLNFSDAVKLGNCSVDIAPGNDTVAQWCSNSGASFNSAMTPSELATCMECVYGISTKLVCARDNFSIRPEAFLINLDDQNQTDSTNPATPQARLTTNLSGVTAPTATQLNLAAGYAYNLEVNATNHLSNLSSVGYNFHLNTVPGTSSGYYWSPNSGTLISGCNDIANKLYTTKFINGSADMNVSTAQVGDYLLKLNDTAWTSIDSVQQSHHTGAYFLSGSDCVLNSSNAASVNSFDNLNGCNISSSHDSSTDSNLKYRDLNVTLYPYKFDMSGITPSHGENSSSTFNANSFIYMSEMSKDEEMSFHLNGEIRAVGYNNQTLSNFVDNCYAKPVRLTVDKSLASSSSIDYRYNLKNIDPNINDRNGSINGATGVINLATNDFNKSNNGSVHTVLNLNFDRNLTIVMNPEELTFTTYDVNCTNPATECTFSADLINTKKAEAYLDLNQTESGLTNQRIKLKHYYGRTHASRQRYENNTGTANIYYEVYCFNTIDGNTCDKNLLQDPTNLKRTDDIRWFINTEHNISNDGNVTLVVQRDGTNVDANDIVDATDNPTENPSVTSLNYDETKGYPYKTTMENSASGWLIYNEDNPTATRNQFSVEFETASGGWSGEHNTDTTTKSVGAVRTNRRSLW